MIVFYTAAIHTESLLCAGVLWVSACVLPQAGGRGLAYTDVIEAISEHVNNPFGLIWRVQPDSIVCVLFSFVCTIRRLKIGSTHPFLPASACTESVRHVHYGGIMRGSSVEA